MKIKKHIRPLSIAAFGLFLGRGAQADTVLDFDTVPLGQPVNAAPGVLQTFGDYASASSDGVTVTGFGTPNIGLTWSAVGFADARWDYYNDGGAVWSAGQLNDSSVGSEHDLTFAPNNPGARVVVKSFNFHPYYNSTERFSYRVSVLAGATVVSGPTTVSFLSDSLKDHPVNINYTGGFGQTLKLRLERIASTLGAGEVEGDPFDIAVDDISFAQTPQTIFPSGPQVVTNTPADGQSGVAAVYYPYAASITNGALTLDASTIRLKLDGTLVSPAPTISTDGSVTNVNFLGTSLLSSGAHVYSLTYSDNSGGSYTNDVQFLTIYATLPMAYANPPGSGHRAGFTYRTVAAYDGVAPLDSTLARAEAQLAGTLIDTNTSQPFTNSAVLGPNSDGSYDVDTVLNFDDDLTSAGNFPDDAPFPGLPNGFDNNFSTEALLFLDLANGYYRFGVNSDDGFRVTAIPPQGVAGSPVVLGLFDNGRGADDTLFDFFVPVGGVYPFRVVYFESTGNSSCEFFSANVVTGTKILVNDLSNVNAVKSYRALAPRILSITRGATDVVVSWAYGSPPFQVQVKTDLNNPNWTNSGTPTSSRTAHVPIQPGAGFIRVVGQP